MNKYNLIQEGYDALYALGEDAKNILSQHAMQIPSVQMSWKNKIKNIFSKEKKEYLSAAKMKELFGANYRGIIYCDIDSSLRWRGPGFQGYSMRGQDISSFDIYSCKEILEREPNFSNLEFVAPVVMEVSGKKFPQIGKLVTDPTHVPNGSAVIGTIITRNRQNGQIMPVSKLWMAVDNTGIAHGAARRGAELFLELITYNAQFRAALISANTK